MMKEGENDLAPCYLVSVDKTDLLDRLKIMEPELRSAGLDALYLFGSRARGEGRPDSDVDLAFDETRMVSLIERARITINLENILGAPVDLVERCRMHPLVMQAASADLMRVF